MDESKFRNRIKHNAWVLRGSVGKCGTHNLEAPGSISTGSTFFMGATLGKTLAGGVPRGSVVKCLTRNPGVLGSSLTGSSGFFRGSVLGQDTSEPSLVLVKPRKA